MPKQYLMSWEGSPYFRWVKMYKGTRYRVSCAELQAMVYTQEGSYKLANEWWTKKVAELSGGSPRERMLAAYDERQRAIRESSPPPSREKMEQIESRLIDRLETLGEIDRKRQAGIPANEIEEIDRLPDVVPAMRPPAEADRTVKAAAERFLALEQADTRPTTYLEVHDVITSLYPLPCLGQNLSTLNEDTIEDVYLWLRSLSVSNHTKRKRGVIITRFVRYCWEKRLVNDLPRNLNRLLDFKIQKKKVKVWSADQIRECLDLLSPRTKIWALLGLNCGMTNVDIGQMTKDMVDLELRTLTRRRVKTGEHDDVPTVTYRLWPETLDALRSQWSDHPTLVLTSEAGTALWTAVVDDKGKVRRKDLIATTWKRCKPRPTIPIKAFRSIAATLLESHESYGRHVEYFLGHSPKSVAARHYAAPSDDLFARATDWLRDQIIR